MIQGKTKDTATVQILEKTGISREVAHIVDNSISVVGTIGGAGAIQAGKGVALVAQPTARSANIVLKAEQVRVVPKGVEKVTVKYNGNVTKLEQEISGWLGKDTRLIKNPSGDTVLLSKDGVRRARFDFNRPTPHENPHGHIEIKRLNGSWDKSGPIYPKDVPHR